MPIHVAVAIRALEEALEAEGLIKTLDSVGVTIQKAKEAAGTPKLLPAGAAKTVIIRGNVYTAH